MGDNLIQISLFPSLSIFPTTPLFTKTLEHYIKLQPAYYRTHQLFFFLSFSFGSAISFFLCGRLNQKDIDILHYSLYKAPLIEIHFITHSFANKKESIFSPILLPNMPASRKSKKKPNGALKTGKITIEKKLRSNDSTNIPASPVSFPSTYF